MTEVCSRNVVLHVKYTIRTLIKRRATYVKYTIRTLIKRRATC